MSVTTLQWRKRRAAWLTIGVLALVLACCSEDNPDPYQPLSEACDACLLENGSQGCGDAYDACEVLKSCDDLVLCELYQQCYLEPKSSDCSQSHGCNEAIAAEPLQLAEAFEMCARSTCRQVCGFAE